MKGESRLIVENVNIEYAIEGILFAAGEPVKSSKLAAVLESTIEEIDKAAKKLQESYDSNMRGLKIIEIDEGYQLCSRPEYYAYIQDVLGEQRRQALSNAAMEALAIIAYKQPVTKGQVEFIRGVNSDGAVNRLVERGLVEECGRLDAPGRPILFRTTQNFLRCFGLKTPQELPAIDFSKISTEYEQYEIESADTEETIDIAEVDENTEE
ncbi:MAG: SMC-Scp complex subunit ScpB [Eubacteriales bacterium]|nr:SMC-Scp complex subunit ScpB [Eubacteriales bacterium]